VNGATADFMKLEKPLVWKIARDLDVRFDEKEKAIIMASESVSYNATLVLQKDWNYLMTGIKMVP